MTLKADKRADLGQVLISPARTGCGGMTLVADTETARRFGA
jgi:hypothetical protein